MVSLNLVLGDRILDVNGVVVYLEDLDGDRCGMGIEFTELNADGQAMLDDFVGRFESESAED